MNRIISFALFLACVVALAGCGGSKQYRVKAQDEIWTEKEDVIGVVLTAPDKFGFYAEGTATNLDITIINGLMRKLRAHLASLDTAEVFALDKRAQEKLKEHDLRVVRHEGKIDFDDLKNFTPPDKEVEYSLTDLRPLKEEYGYDKILLINFTDYKFGISRPYDGFTATGDPYASLVGIAQIVDLESNRLLWYYVFDISKFVEGDWDQPPEYPGLTQAIYDAVAELRSAIGDELARESKED